MQKIVTNLWFDNQAEEAAKFYCSLFDNSKVKQSSHYDEASAEASGQPAGSVLTVEFELAGQQFLALNGGPIFKFTPAISLFVSCVDTGKVDELWGQLVDGGSVLMPLQKYPFSEYYGWLQDKYGLSWQIMVAPDGKVDQPIVPELMFVGQQAGKAEEAMEFYVSIFDDSKIGVISRYGEGQEPDKAGTINYAEFTLEGQQFKAMDSNQVHDFSFTEAISFIVNCETQEEVDSFWSKLSAVPESEQCGWLKDKYGVSWQIVPKQLGQLLSDPDAAKASRAMQAMLAMKKIDIAALEQAANKG